jgi:predicted PurR-regulated permease PerM
MNRITWKDCFKLGITAIAVYLIVFSWPAVIRFLAELFGALKSFMLGLVVAYVVNILMSFYERHYFRRSRAACVQKSRRPICLLLAFLSLIVIISLIASVVIPGVTKSINIIVNGSPAAVKNLTENDLVQKYLPQVYLWLKSLNWDNLVSQASNFIRNNYSSILGTVSTAASGIVSFFIGIIFSIYLLMGKEKLKLQLKMMLERFLPGKFTKKLYYFLSVMNHSFHSFIVGQVTEACILGSLCTTGLLLLRVPYAPIIGVLIGFSAFVPIFGAYIGAAVGTLMIITDTPSKAVTFLVFLVLLQQFEGNFIYPRVVGSSIGMPGLWVLTAVTVGGGVGGIPGMLIAVPFTAGIYRMLKDDLKKHPSGNPEIHAENQPNKTGGT